MADTIASGAPAPSPHDYRFAGIGFQNWCPDDAPPVLVNPLATVHAKVAWCWGEMHQIDDLANVLCTSENDDLARIGNVLVHKAMGLIAMLEHLAEYTNPRNTTTEARKEQA